MTGGGSSNRIIELTETGSTNKDAMRLALHGEPLPLWVSARRQTSGRGRAGRSWESLDGNLHASAAVMIEAPLAHAGELSLVAGISLYDTVQQTCPLAQNATLRLKWPNDIMMGTAKLGGILIESTTARGEPGFLAVIGFGMNVTRAPSGLGRAVACLRDVCDPPDAAAIVPVLARNLDYWLGRWNGAGGFSAHILPAWRQRGLPPGEPITITTAEGVVVGAYRGIDDRGHLLMEMPAGQFCTFGYGDVMMEGELPESGTT